jgi:hypothetical protein
MYRVIQAKEAQATGEAVGVALALEVYHRQHGQYPMTLAELVPQYLPNFPLDYSTGKPLLYELRGGKPVLYGRGLPARGSGKWQNGMPWPSVPSKGDWVLYPPPEALAPPATQPASRALN